MKLENFTKEQVELGEFPLIEILRESLFYPACGFDGNIIRLCNTQVTDFSINSFIFCDYHTDESELQEVLNNFKGYEVFATRHISPNELYPPNHQSRFILPPTDDKSNYSKSSRFKNNWKPFAKWIIYERKDNFEGNHGTKRFSMLYIGGEAVEVYQKLYWDNCLFPKALAIIRPGTGFGFNYTDFYDQNKALAWSVLNNDAGIPNFIFTDRNDLNWFNKYVLFDHFNDYRYETYLRSYYGSIKLFKQIS